MMKAILGLAVAGLAAAVLILPNPEPPPVGLDAAVDPPPVAVCPVEEGSARSTTIGIASNIDGLGRFTMFAGGASAGSVEFSTGASGSAAIAMSDVAAVGTAAGLAELPSREAAAASLLLGAESVAVATCLATPAQQTFLAGGSTISGEQYQVQIMNPYAGEALVDLIVQSEAGLETTPQLRGVSVPSRSAVMLDLSEVLPGRESLSITIEAVSGSVMAVGRFGVGADVALWHSSTPALDWYVPIPAGGLGGELVISTGVAAEVEYQLDLYGPEGLIEAFEEGVVPVRGVSVVPIGDLGLDAASAIRVVSTQPVAVFFRAVSEAGVAISNGSAVTASRWLLPGAGLVPGSTGSVVILNAGIDEAAVTITAHREQSASEQVPLAGGGVIEFPTFDGLANAYTVESEGFLVPLWVTATGTGAAYSIGVPILDE